jgi:hypothetical protein
VLDEGVPIVGHSRDELEKSYALCDDKQAVFVDMKQSSDTSAADTCGKYARTKLLTKGVITYDQAHGGGTPKAAVDAEWDGPSEVAAASVEDLAVMTTWFDSDDAENKSAYKLPHHRAADKAVVKAAVNGALAALNGARGGVDIRDSDRAGVYTHLTRHLREDFEVPNEEIPELSSANSEGDVEPELESVDDASKAIDPDRFEALEKRLETLEGTLSNLETLVKSLQETPSVPVDDKWIGPKSIAEEIDCLSEDNQRELESYIRGALRESDLPQMLRSFYTNNQ